MKLALYIAILLVCPIALTQEPKKPESPKEEIHRLDPATQPELSEANRQAAEARSATEAADARYQAAQQRIFALIYKAMDELKLSPKEWTIKQDKDGIYFERIKDPFVIHKAAIDPDLPQLV